MGLLGGLLLLPLSGPVWGFRLFLERLREEADAVLYDEGRSFGELIDLSMRHKAGKLTDDEFAQQEAAVLDRLRSMRDYRDELMEAEQYMDEDESFDPDVNIDEYESIDTELVVDGVGLPDAEPAVNASGVLDGEPVLEEVQQ